ncbi:MAG: pbp2 [Chlamydiales bacterium]|nr:pbp2 [Chlamydiales bacterium]
MRWRGQKGRLIFLSLTIFALFSLLIVEFYRIQMIEGDKWARLAESQHFFFVEEPFLRGAFFSHSAKKGHIAQAEPLVFDIQKFHLYADPLSIPEPFKEEVVERLSSFLKGPKEPLSLHLLKKTRSRKLAQWLDIEKKEEIQSWWQSFARRRRLPRNALYFISDYQRSYPYGSLLGQVLHTVQHSTGSSEQAIPTGGLELYFNSYLKGHPGRRRLMRSPRNALETGQMIKQPMHGADIYLSINAYIQAIAEEELALGVKKAKAKSGFAVMMNPYSGEIMAIAQYPFFDPARCSDYFNQPDMIEHTKLRALIDVFEPGSTIKPITAAIALMANQERARQNLPPLFTPEEKIATANGHFPGRKKPIQDTSLHHFLNLNLAMQKSSNIYVARLVQRVTNALGNQWYRDALTQFGLGQKTGLEMPAESRGMLPTPGKRYPSGHLEWSEPTPFSMAFGHNLQVTAVQMMRAYALFANGGYLVEPTLVRQIVRRDEEGRLDVLLDHTQQERQKAFPQVLDRAIVDQVVQAMKYVTKPGGSGSRADIPGFTEVGKSGTSRKIVDGKYTNKKHIASFIGFAPVKEAEFVLYVSLDEPEVAYIPGVGSNHHGGVSAAPIFRQIAARSLEYLGTAPDDPAGYPIGDSRYDPAQADWLREVKKLKEIYEAWNQIK